MRYIIAWEQNYAKVPSSEAWAVYNVQQAVEVVYLLCVFEVDHFCREIRNQIRAIRDLPQKDKFRAYATTKMLDKLYK